MRKFSAHFINQIRQALPLSQVVQRYTSLDNRFYGLCLFHQEKSPSFNVNDQKGLWYCFGCHRGGDLFKFVMEAEKLSFAGAVNLLAQEAGIALPRSERFKVFVGRRFERVKKQLKKLQYCRNILLDYEIKRYAELRIERRKSFLKEYKDSKDYLRIDLIENVQFDDLDAFILKVKKILDEIEEEIRYGRKPRNAVAV